MRRLALYPGDLRAPVERVTALDYNNTCGRCELGLVGQSTCLPPAGTGPGGVVVVVDQITAEDDRVGAQAQGNLNKMLAYLVNKYARRPFLLDAAIKCHAGAKIDDEHVEQCRPYLRQTIEQAKPDRIIVTGPKAARAVLGRSPHLQSVRKGYGWLWTASWADAVQLADGRTCRPVPVFLVMSPWVTATNAFMKQWLSADLEWACNTPVPALPPWDDHTEVVETAQDAEVAAQYLRAAEAVTIDVETSGQMHSGGMRVVSLAMAAAGRSWVWDRVALADGGCFEVAAELLEDATVPKIGQSIKYDMQAIEQGMGITVRGLAGDTRVWHRQLESDSLSDLSTMAELVGMGGDSWEVDGIIADLAKQAAQAAQSTKRALIKARPEIAAALKGTKDQVEILLSKFGSTLSAADLTTLKRGYNPRQYVYGDVPTDILSRYNAADTVITAAVADHLRPQMVERDLMYTWDTLWGPATDALVQVETWGFPVDRGRVEMMSRHFGAQLDALRVKFAIYPELDPNSPPSVAKLLFDKLKLKPTKTSEKTGAPSTDKVSLDALLGRHPVVEDLIEWRHVSKLKSQYADGLLLHIAPDGRIHTTYNVDGARSGRVSCVAAWTPVVTARGVLPISDVVVGDAVFTHKERWRAVTRSWIKGTEEMYEVRLSNGEVLTCTADHRVLAADQRWVALRVIINEHFPYLGVGPFEPGRGPAALQERGAADRLSDCGPVGYDVPERPARAEVQDPLSDLRGVEGCALLRFQDGFAEPHEGEGAGGSPALAGGVLGWERVPDLSTPGPTHLRASPGDGPSARLGGFARGPRSSPHRRQPAEQHVGQPGPGDAGGSSSCSLHAGAGLRSVEITAIHRCGSYPVYDLTVEEDESYLAHGVFSHNSENPNMQNIPSEDRGADGKLVKDCFIARPGYMLVAADYKQLEFRVAADLAGDAAMRAVFESGIDFHQATAEFIAPIVWKIPAAAVTKLHRSRAKSFNFGIMYGMQDGGIASRAGCSIEEARAIRQAVLGKFRRFAAWVQECLAYTRKTGLAWTYWGGRKAHCRQLYRVLDADDGKRINAENSSFNCLDAETEALTERGWVRGFDLLREDVLLTKNPVTGALEWQGMTDLKQWPDYEGPLVEFKSRSFSAVSTPDHRWLVQDKHSGAVREKTTATLSTHGDHRIHRTGDYRPAVTGSPSGDEAELLGWFVTDGSLSMAKGGSRGPRPHPRCSLVQSPTGNPVKHARIVALLARLDTAGEVRVQPPSAAHGCTTWRLGRRLSALLYGLAPDRRLTMGALLRQDRVALDRLREAMLLGDGSRRGASWAFTSGTRGQAEAFQVLCTLTGSAASIVWRDMSGYAPTSAKMTNVPRMTGVWIVTILARGTVQVLAGHRREFQSRQGVWCPVVPNTFFVMRRAGQVAITGNTPVQGTASFYCLASVTALVHWIRRTRLDVKVAATVHDSIVLEVREDLVLTAARELSKTMTGWPTMTNVPLDIDVTTGRSWGSMKEYLLPEAEAALLLGGHGAASQVMRAQMTDTPATS